MSLLLAVDPGVRSPGAALFDGDRLVACDRVRIPEAYHGYAHGQRWLLVSRLIVEWAQVTLKQLCARVPIAAVVYERPQIYRMAKSQGADPNDLPGLAAIGAGVAAFLNTLGLAEVRSPLPAEWAMGTSKTKTGSAWASVRGRRVRERLRPGEETLIPDQHDALDAAAIGLWAVGRFTRRRVYSAGGA